MKQPDWNDLHLFLAVASAGSLSGAAPATGASQATLSRRMTALEHDLDRRLFQRGAQGYALTPAGAALAERVGLMHEAAEAIDEPATATVRISAGSWTMRLLTGCIAEFWTPDASWMPEFVAADHCLDIARREVDIGIRNARPSEPWLAMRQIGHRDYATYQAKGASPRGFVCPSNPAMPTARYIQANHGDAIVLCVGDQVQGLGAVKAGLALMVLPTFVGDREPDLERASETIPELRSEQWLVTHHEERHHKPVRAATDALGAFLERENAQ